MLLLMSKTASIPVERSDKDSEAMAAYTTKRDHVMSYRRIEQQSDLTLQNAEENVCQQTRPDSDLNLESV